MPYHEAIGTAQMLVALGRAVSYYQWSGQAAIDAENIRQASLPHNRF